MAPHHRRRGPEPAMNAGAVRPIMASYGYGGLMRAELRAKDFPRRRHHPGLHRSRRGLVRPGLRAGGQGRLRARGGDGQAAGEHLTPWKIPAGHTWVKGGTAYADAVRYGHATPSRVVRPVAIV